MRPRLPSDMRIAPRLDPRGPRGRIRRRHALLVNPFYPKDPHGSFMKHSLTPSLALTTIAAATPAGWSVDLRDENLLGRSRVGAERPQVVGITVHLTMADRAYELSRWFRNRGVVTVLGGPHVTVCPEEAAPHADVIAIGDGVETWPRILGDIERGRHQSVYRADFSRSYAESPEPRREVLPRGSFLTPFSLIATRGCPNRCDFCYLSTGGLGMPYQARAVEQVVTELRARRPRYAVFLDNNLSARPAWLRELCRRLASLRIIWSAAVTLDVAEDPALVLAMARAGCVGVFVGFESITNRNLVDAGKRCPHPDAYHRLVEVFHDHGIQVNGSFVFGFDHDTTDVFDRTADFIESARLECATFQILTPYPGTPLFARLEAEGRILHRHWPLFDTSHAVFRPRHMSPGELEEGYGKCYRRVFTLGSIWRRRPADRGALIPYLLSSILYKHANPVWHRVIRHGLTEAVWLPLVAASRLRHLKYRKRLLAACSASASPDPAPAGI